jgi:hypothetical protein
MRKRMSVVVAVAVMLFGAIAAAQETRGNISGTVRDQSGVVPAASVKITNTGTNVSQQLTTNDKGYFEAPLLIAGTYDVAVEMTGFKTFRQTNIPLSVGQSVALDVKLEVGSISETVEVVANKIVIDTNAVTSGLTFESRLISELPTFSSMPVLLIRNVSGVAASGAASFATQGFVGGPSTQAGPVGGVGSTEYTIDGATNNGQSRQLATSPNSDMLEEVRIETSNFDASVGHGTGLGISMMTKAGNNRNSGTGAYQFWTSRLNGANYFQKKVFEASPADAAAYKLGKSNNLSFTNGGPVVIPGVVNGKSKLFYFVNYSFVADLIPGNTMGRTSTIPANAAQLKGDFSDLLLLPNPAQYQIYDPLTTRADPNRPGHVIRDPFPGNIIPANRIVNPMYPLYTKFLPTPNQNPTSGTQAPTANFLGAAEPDQTHSHVWGGRVDFNPRQSDRLFLRAAGSYFTEEDDDWTYANPESKGLHSAWRLRQSWTYTGNWTHIVSPRTIIDTQFSTNWFADAERRLGLKRYNPGEFGFPQYVTDFCTNRRGGCQMPQVQINGYQTFGNNVGLYGEILNLQGQVNATHVHGAHTLKVGTDNRNATRKIANMGNTSGVAVFNNTYTKAADDTTGAASLGLSWAAFMLGTPTSFSIDDNLAPELQSPFYSFYAQDTWRLRHNLTVNYGFRYEWEDGIREKQGRDLVGWDPNATTSITGLAEAAYAASPIAQRPASTFQVRGGPLFANSTPNGRSWAAQGMWMPRFSAAYSVNRRTVVKAGYGMFYDTLNASAYTPTTTGYSTTTTSVASNDLGLTWALGNPKAGILPQQDPFPVRADGTRFDVPVGDKFGIDTLLGQGVTIGNINREHPRVQRYRVSLQREIWGNTSVEVAYNFQIGDRLATTIRQDYLPEEFWNGSNVRDLTQQNLLQGTVPNPFLISKFDALKTSNPALYARLAGNGSFTATTVQLQRLLRGPYPQYTSVSFSNLPLGRQTTHGVELNFSRRMSNGLAMSASYSGNRIRNLELLNEYDREPTLWQPNSNGRPHRVTASGIYELPFGGGRKFSNHGILSNVLGGWQVGGTFEYQPGGLLGWNNLFFYGDFKDIPVDNPTIDKWFNVDAGFERDPLKAPATFQKRVFPFRIDGVRGPNLLQQNVNFLRSFKLPGRRSFSVRVDIINLTNRTTFSNPNVNPTSTDFGRITTASSSTPRFVQFVTKLNF